MINFSSVVTSFQYFVCKSFIKANFEIVLLCIFTILSSPTNWVSPFLNNCVITNLLNQYNSIGYSVIIWYLLYQVYFDRTGIYCTSDSGHNDTLGNETSVVGARCRFTYVSSNWVEHRHYVAICIRAIHQFITYKHLRAI